MDTITQGRMRMLQDHRDLYDNVMDHCKGCGKVVECAMDSSTWQPGGWCGEIDQMIDDYRAGD